MFNIDVVSFFVGYFLCALITYTIPQLEKWAVRRTGRKKVYQDFNHIDFIPPPTNGETFVAISHTEAEGVRWTARVNWDIPSSQWLYRFTEESFNESFNYWKREDE